MTRKKTAAEQPPAERRAAALRAAREELAALAVELEARYGATEGRGDPAAEAEALALQGLVDALRALRAGPGLL
jgi:hypothetical protein